MLSGYTLYLEMMSNKVQIVYSSKDENPKEIHDYFSLEAKAMEKVGFIIGSIPNDNANVLIYRGFAMYSRGDYPKDIRYIQGEKEYLSTMQLSLYYPLIKDLSIPTFFVKELNDEIQSKMDELGWERVFIKNDVKSLKNVGAMASVYPDNTLTNIKDNLNQYPVYEFYAIRKYLNPDFFKEEDRYWVLNGKVFFRKNNVPPIVREAARRLNCLGSKYYVIDATPDVVVEVNPGEGADRYGANSPELFAKWFKKAFL